jgi:hypothetical protein
MRPSGTEKIGGGSRFENKLEFIGEYPELSLPLSGAFPWATWLLKLLCCQWEIPDRRNTLNAAETIHGVVWLIKKYSVIPD